jgi:hypothetical protein
MDVPFEQLGPGQKGRLAFQVIGKDGPILNPQNIRYMSPDKMPIGENLGLGLDTAVAGVNLLVSAGTLALAAATLREVRRIHKQLNEIDQKIDSLRHAIHHVFARALSDHEIDLIELGRLHADVEAYVDALPAPLLFNFGLRLSTDVADSLSSVCSLLLQLRMMLAERHNLRVQGDPFKCLAIDTMQECLGQDIGSIVRGAIAYSRSAKHYGEGQEVILRSIGERFTWSDEADIHYFRELLDAKMASPLDDAFRSFLYNSACLYNNLPDELFEDPDDDKLGERLFSLCHAWLLETDGGLVLRTRTELEGISKGYQVAFWPGLADSETRQTVALGFRCELPSNLPKQP